MQRAPELPLCSWRRLSGCQKLPKFPGPTEHPPSSRHRTAWSTNVFVAGQGNQKAKKRTKGLLELALKFIHEVEGLFHVWIHDVSHLKKKATAQQLQK